jgi:hypothetical protein
VVPTREPIFPKDVVRVTTGDEFLDGFFGNISRPCAEGFVEGGQTEGLLRGEVSLARLFQWSSWVVQVMEGGVRTSEDGEWTIDVKKDDDYRRCQ